MLLLLSGVKLDFLLVIKSRSPWRNEKAAQVAAWLCFGVDEQLQQ